MTDGLIMYHLKMCRHYSLTTLDTCRNHMYLITNTITEIWHAHCEPQMVLPIWKSLDFLANLCSLHGGLMYIAICLCVCSLNSTKNHTGQFVFRSVNHESTFSLNCEHQHLSI